MSTALVPATRRRDWVDAKAKSGPKPGPGQPKRTLHDMHVKLWRLSGPTRRIKVNSLEMSDQFGLGSDRFKRWMRMLVADGRIRVVGHRVRNVPTYLVSDPKEFLEHGPRGRVSSWG